MFFFLIESISLFILLFDNMKWQDRDFLSIIKGPACNFLKESEGIFFSDMDGYSHFFIPT